MPTKDDFNPDHPLPLFLADKPEQQGIGKAWDRAVISSRILKASILVATATAIGIAILSVGNPVTLLADVTASACRPQISAPAWHRSVDANNINLPPMLRLCRPQRTCWPARKMLPPLNPPIRARRKIVSHRLKALFRQFQAWAAEKDAQAQVGPVQSVQDAPAPVVQNAPAQIAEDTRASLKPKQKHRHVRALRNARAEMRPVHNPRKKVRREQNSRVQDPPAQEARAPEQGQFVQNAQPPSFLQTFGSRN